MAGPSTQGSSRPPQKPKHNWVNKVDPNSRRRSRLLDKRKENYMRYDLEDLFKRAKVPENHIASIAATILAKGQRNSIQEAKDYAKAKMEEGTLDEPTYRSVLQLIDGYSKWR